MNNRKTAYEALLAFEADRAYSNIAVNNAIKKNNPDDHAFVRNLVYGVLENQIYLEYRLDQLIPKGFNKLNKSVKVMLLMGAYQLEFMDSVPNYAAINEMVSMAKKLKRGLHGFVNAVLHSYSRKMNEVDLPDKNKDLVKYFSIKYSYHKDIVEMWLKMFGESRTENLLRAGNAIPPLTIRVNTLKTTTNNLKNELEFHGFKVENVGKLIMEKDTDRQVSPDVLNRVEQVMLKITGGGLLETQMYKNGLFSVQDVSSAIAIFSLDPRPGDKIIDICAAPGGKTMCSTTLMEGKGNIISCDLYRHKLKLIKKEAIRLGVADMITVKQNDATILCDNFLGIADKVIADVPCSGLGVVRRRPEIKLHMDREKIENLSKIQLEILDKSALYVKSGGIILYSTCTISEIENQTISAMFLKKNKNFKKIRETQLFPDISSSDGFYFCAFQRFL